MSSNTQHEHNRGQKDGANNTYNPPPSVRPIIDIFDDRQTTERKVEELEAYKKGFEHGRDNR